VAKPDTLLAWYRQLVAYKSDGSGRRGYPGRPRMSPEVETLVVRMARENRGWGYDRIVVPWPIWVMPSRIERSATSCAGIISHQHRSGVARRVGRSSSDRTWRCLAAVDFFTVEVLAWRGLMTHYVLFFIEVGTRGVCLGGITRHPDAGWMEQIARNATMQDSGYLNGCCYLLHDRDQKFCREFRETLAACGVKCLPLPARSPNLNAERWVRSIKEECLSKLILFGKKSLQRVVSNYLKHYHQERNHQGNDNLLLLPVAVAEASSRGAIRCRERLGGLLKYYTRAA
jgi:hypothetical protein